MPLHSRRRDQSRRDSPALSTIPHGVKYRHRLKRPCRWGCFESIQLDHEGNGLRGWLLRHGVGWRTRLMHSPYGDQAIFVERDTVR